MKKLKRQIILLAAGVAFALSPLPVSSAPTAVSVSDSVTVAEPAAAAIHNASGLEQAVSDWINGLAAEPGFEMWTTADWDIFPLGPGTHSWLIALTAEGEDAGYMIVSQKSDGGYQLTEYGKGAYPLFSLKTLRQSLLQRELIDLSSASTCLDEADRYLTGPLESFWKVECGGDTYYFDAKSGGELPDLTSYLKAYGKNEKNAASSPNPVETSPVKKPGIAVIDRLEVQPIDPYDQPSWIKDKGRSGSKDDFAAVAGRLKEQKDEAKLIYTVKLYGGQALYPLSVTGYHKWSDGSPFLMLEQNGARYVRWPLPDGGSIR